MTFSEPFLLLNLYFLSHKVILCESGSLNGKELFPELASDSELCSHIHANWALRHPLKKYCISSVDTYTTLLRYLVHCLGFLYMHMLNPETIYLPTWDTSVSHCLLPLQAEPTCLKPIPSCLFPVHAVSSLGQACSMRKTRGLQKRLCEREEENGENISLEDGPTVSSVPR